MRRWLTLVIVLLVSNAVPVSASAQTDSERNVDISYDIGDFDAEQADWPVTVVYVSGDLEAGAPFTVYLGDDEGELWSSTQEFSAPVTAVTVVPFVPVGAVTRTAVAQDQPAGPGQAGSVQPPPLAVAVPTPPAVLDDVLVEGPAPTPNSPGRIGGPITEVLGQGTGGAGGGILALSMVLSVILVAIVFRTPLPSQATQRWTK